MTNNSMKANITQIDYKLSKTTHTHSHPDWLAMEYSHFLVRFGKLSPVQRFALYFLIQMKYSIDQLWQ